MNGEDDDAALFEATVSGEPSAPSVAPAAAEPTTEQKPSATPATQVNRDQPTGRFAKAATVPEIATGTPAAEPDGGTMVPQQALHEAREREKTERGRADRLEQALLALQKPTQTATPAAEAAKPIELWDDPDKWADTRLETKLTPLQEEIANTRAFYSNRDAVREHGDDIVKAAKAALDTAIKTGTMNDAQVTAHLKRSMDPVGEIVDWHKAQTNQQRIGNDPDAFVQTELEKMLADPAKKAELLARINGTAQVPASTAPVNRTVIPPSLNRIGSPANGAPAGDAPSDSELFASITGGR